MTPKEIDQCNGHEGAVGATASSNKNWGGTAPPATTLRFGAKI